MKRVAAIFMLFVLATTAFAEQMYTLSGVVASGDQPLPGVTVTVTTPNGPRTLVTDVNGHWSLSLPPGKYTVRFELEGFGTLAMPVIIVKENVTLDNQLHPSAVAEAITVTASGPYLESPATAMLANVTKTARYQQIREWTYLDTREAPLTTFSIDVDRASYATVRSFLHHNELPPGEIVRIEEMVNYFTYRYASPADGKPFAISTEVAGCPWEPTHRIVRIGIQAKQIDQLAMAPNNLVFLVDVSGSMEPDDRLPLIIDGLKLLAKQLRPQDSVAIVVYAGAAGLVLPPTPGNEQAKILAALDGLHAGGSTAGAEGIQLAYQVAADAFKKDGNNRVILATDGDFNVGVSDPDALEDLIASKRKSGIYLTCLGVGDDNYQDATMERLADKGNGNYAYLDSIEEARRVFLHDLTSTIVTVADDVKIQVEFDPDIVAAYRQIGYEDRALANKDFEDDTKDAGELGAGDSVTALYEIVPRKRAVGRIAAVRVRYKEPRGETSKLIAEAVNDSGISAWEATPETQFAAAITEFGMLLRDSQHRGRATWDDALALARAMRGEDFDERRGEALQLMTKARELSGPKMAGR